MKKIDCCLCVYNTEEYIGNAIESILSQTYPEFHLYVVNDASIDRTEERIKSYLADERVTLISLKENIGTYAAKNLVLKNFAQGDYWAHHDADDYSEPERFEKQLNYLEEKKLDGCGTAIDEIYHDNLQPRIPSNDPLVLEKDGLYHRRNNYPESITLENISDNIVDLPKLKIAMNGSLLFNLEAVKKLGGFDGTTWTGGDSDFLWRFIKFYKFGNMSEVLYHRRFHKSSLTQAPETGYDSERRKKYAEKAHSHHITCMEMIKNRNHVEALKACTYDMYHPDIQFTTYSNNTTK